MFMNHYRVNLDTSGLYLSCCYKLDFDMDSKTWFLILSKPTQFVEIIGVERDRN